ncbi:MAG: amidohydrolase [Acidobacteria bacterium]|nr:amidohydrolase [Acidobacteriota bacterium]
MLLPAPPPPPALIITGADLWVDDGKVAEAKRGWALVVRKGKIAAIGEAEKLLKAQAGVEQVVLPGGTLLPGLIEGHAHVESLGALARKVDLAGCRSLEEALTRVKAWAERNPGGWIEGRGWDQNRWPGKAFPTAIQLDSVTGGRPAVMTRVDGHALWANSSAMKVAGLGPGTQAPAGGQILRDGAGAPTGLLVDAAQQLVLRSMPAPGPQERSQRLLAGMRILQSHGFTAVADMGVDREALSLYRKLQGEGRLPIRVFAYLAHDPKLMLSELKGRRGAGTAIFQVQGVKFFLDGALGSRGARLLEPYADQPGQLGLWVTEPAKVEQGAAVTLRAGYQPAIHAIGDAANRMALELLERARRKAPRSLHPRIEHAQIVAPEDAARFGPLGIVASIQPVHCTSDHSWTPARLGPSRVEEAFPWRRFLQGGALLAFGSDAPVEDPNPFYGLASAETRQDPEGQPPGGFLPAQNLTRAESLRGFTWGNGQALGRKDLGVLKAGAVADLLWVQAPLGELPPSELRKLRPGRMWLDGRERPLEGR